MHDDLIGSCDHCKQFVFAFSEGSPLANWGFCLMECGGTLPSEEFRKELEMASQRGDNSKVFNTKGLFEDSEDGCPQFEPR